MPHMRSRTCDTATCFPHLPCTAMFSAWIFKECEHIAADHAKFHLSTYSLTIYSVSQVMNLKDSELDQLADFLWHNIQVHREFYRLPESCTQVTKISKLLIAAERGGMARHRGRCLDQLDAEIEESRGDDAQTTQPGQEEPNSLEVQKNKEKRSWEDPQPSVSTPKRQKKERTPWSADEKSAVLRHCQLYIRRGEVPGISVCSRAIAAEPALRQRSWRAVKYYCHNVIVAERRRCDKQ